MNTHKTVRMDYTIHTVGEGIDLYRVCAHELDKLEMITEETITCFVHLFPYTCMRYTWVDKALRCYTDVKL